MPVQQLHENEVDIDSDLVIELLQSQFPRWADLPLTQFDSTGTVNVIYRLGPDMYVRLPRVANWAWHLKAESKWLPRMRPHIPLELPEVLGKGVPTEQYPLDWCVQRWIDGETWSLHRVRDERESALDVAGFLRALQGIDTSGVEPLDPQFDVPLLAAHDGWIRESIDRSKEWIDAPAVTAAWEAALELPAFDGPYVWVHSDLGPDNMLVRDGRLCGVIDWGSVHVGDAARDLTALWMFPSGSRTLIRETLEVNDATWARARAWTLRAVGGIHYYWESNPVFAQNALARLQEVIADFGSDT